MRKKNYLMLMFVFAALASCTTDECDHIDGPVPPPPPVVVFTYEYLSAGTGSWYEEAENEEFRCTVNGKFYDKYCNLLRAAETEGTYQISENGTRLTEYYKFMGQNQTMDWKVSDVEETSFKISADMVATHIYEKVVEAHTLSIGQVQQIQFTTDNPSYSVQTYISNNERIAAVDDNGVITASGEKGTTYIKVSTTKGNVWVKVVVGEDFNDIWYDYSSILNSNYTGVRNQLGAPDQTGDNGSDAIYFYNLSTLHDVLESLYIYSDKTTQRVTQIDLILKESVPEDVVSSYMDARYFYIGTYGSQRHYSSRSSLEESWSAWAYDTSKHTVMIMTAENYMVNTGLSMFPPLDSVFGMTQNEVNNKMAEKGYIFLQSTNDVYSFNGTDAFYVTDNERFNAVEFVYNSDKVVSQYWLYLSESTDQFEVYHYLNENYIEAKEEEVSGYGCIYYNAAKTLRVHFKLWENAVVFTDLTLKAFDQMILRNFWKGLGMTRSELLATFGTPDKEDESGNIRYVGLYDYLIRCDYLYDSASGRYYQAQAYLRDGVEHSVVSDYLNRLYTFYETGFADGAEVHRWLNASNAADATMRISYYPDYGVVVYGQFKAPAQLSYDYGNYLGKTKSEVKQMMSGKNPASESDTRLLYALSNDEYATNVRFDFSGETVEKAILWLRSEISATTIKEGLSTVYDYVEEGDGYTWYYSHDGKIRVLYQEDLKIIQFISNN